MSISTAFCDTMPTMQPVFRNARLITGLILFVFVTTHLLNHALGVFTIAAAEAGRQVFNLLWRNPVGTTVLYVGLVGHIALVLWSLFQRRHLRMPRWEVLRLVFGLLIPILLLQHIVGTRIGEAFYGIDDNYLAMQFYYYHEGIGGAISQLLLLLLAWTHGCMGVHFWLRIRPWYAAWRPYLRAGAIVLPTLATVGHLDMGREIFARAADPVWAQSMHLAAEAAHEKITFPWDILFYGLFVGSVAAVFGGRWLRSVLEHRRGVVYITYPGGRRVAVMPGTTVLEASRANGIPHASLCGGRGRCSTCRSRISVGADHLPEPTPSELRVLRRVAAPPNVRLACQLKPNHDVEIVPLLPPDVTARAAFGQPNYQAGAEREIAIMFADLRGFTQFSEHRLPYDVVFVLNRYFAMMGEAIGQADGYLDKFIGDGIMALFGLDSGPERGCRDALRACVLMGRALDDLNTTLANDLKEPLKLGIGIHFGHAIVGEMGHGRATALTAIGDAVNTASRLESLTKEFASQLVISEDVATQARVDVSVFASHETAIRGRQSALAIRAIVRAVDLEPLVVTPAPTVTRPA